MQVNRFFSFALAMEFHENKQPYKYEKNYTECVGQALTFPLGKPLHILTREIKNPITIIAFTALACLTATIVFYPQTFSALLPFVKSVKPWAVKAGIFALTQVTIIGLGVRNYGRLTNDELRNKWNRGELEPIYIGNKQVMINN